MTALAYYVSGHGFGHAVRSAEIMRALLRRRAGLEIHVRTTAPAWLFPAGVASCQGGRLDVGVIQPDAVRIDPVATLRQAADLAHDVGRRVADEVAFLRSRGAALVVADVPPPAFLAAAEAGLPSIAVANFSWDWIYEPFLRDEPRHAWLLEWLRGAYAQASLLLRLPFHGDLSAFPAIEDVPTVLRPPSAARPLVRERLGLRAAQQVVLLGFGGLGLSGLPLEALAELREYTFLATEKEVRAGGPLPSNLRLLPVRQDNYNDFIAASDAVISKPGYGMVTSCLGLRVPLLCTDRGGFPEDDVLFAAIRRHGHGLHIPPAELLAGRLGPYLGRLLGSPGRWRPIRADGAEVIAARLLAWLDGERPADRPTAVG